MMNLTNAVQGNRRGAEAAEAAEVAEDWGWDDHVFPASITRTVTTVELSPLRSPRPLRLCGCLAGFQLRFLG